MLVVICAMRVLFKSDVSNARGLSCYCFCVCEVVSMIGVGSVGCFSRCLSVLDFIACLSEFFI